MTTATTDRPNKKAMHDFTDGIFSALPGVTLALLNMALYAALVSFQLRAVSSSRMWFMGSALMIGVIMGGLVFPHLLAWSLGGGKHIGRMSVFLWLISASAATFPGFEHYAYNESLRVVANFCLGLMVAPAYQMFFSLVPFAWRGRLFALTVAVGLIWSMVLRCWAMALPTDANPLHHPLLPTVYLCHAVPLAGFAVLAVYVLVLRPTAVSALPPSPGIALPGIRKMAIYRVWAIGSVVYVLVGILENKIAPFFPAAKMTLAVSMCGIPALYILVSGWMLDSHPDIVFRRLLPLSCCIFISTPALAVVELNPVLHGIVQTATAAVQISFFVVLSVAVAGMASTLPQAVFHSCGLFAVRFGMVGAFLAWKKIHPGGGVTVLAATTLVFVMLAMMQRLQNSVAFIPRTADVPDEFEAVETASAPSPMNKAVFLDGVGLTPRERETAEMVLDGQSDLDIAMAMDISERTVKKHTSSIYRKFGVHSRHELYRLFVEQSLGLRS